MGQDSLRAAIRKRTAALFLGAAGSIAVSAIVSALIFACILLLRSRWSGLAMSRANLELRFWIACVLPASAFLIYGICNFRKFFGKDEEGDGLFYREDECSASDPSRLPAGRILLFAPYMFFIGLRLLHHGAILLFTPVAEPETLLRALGACGRTTLDNLAECSGLSRKRAATLLAVLDATIHTRNREVALTSEWKQLL
ncbi:MAG: hypothetical protein HPZ91_17960 [Lentisphaeria bacterium]|nr:hypothetical protein [Lentisphaeria bacterium]